MERLTERDGAGNAHYPYCFREDTCGGQGSSKKCNRCRFITDVCDKLCAYEDTHLTPEQIVEIDRLYADLAKHLDRVQKELELWHASEPNESIKNEFAKMSTLVCHNCDHKDEYIEELESELAKYQQLEEDGLLLRLPCKVGDTVWFVGNEFVNDYQVKSFYIEENGIQYVRVSKFIGGKEHTNAFYKGDWMNRVFPTQEEAEQALKRLESET